CCAYCGESNPIWIDWSAGSEQSHIEDCQVCCQPNRLFIHLDEFDLSATVDSDPLE
ncbi:MAG: CPXCG motif-containing cysteine-rich protein, partial [Cyanobacteria bacterium J06639_1]